MSIVTKFTAHVSLVGQENEEGYGVAAFKLSQPKDTYEEAQRFIYKYAAHPNFHSGMVQKEYLAEDVVHARMMEYAPNETVDLTPLPPFEDQENEGTIYVQ